MVSEDFGRCKRKVVMYEAFFVGRVKNQCVLKCVWVCSECSERFLKMPSVTGHSANCPVCGARLVLNPKNKWEK